MELEEGILEARKQMADKQRAEAIAREIKKRKVEGGKKRKDCLKKDKQTMQLHSQLSIKIL